MKTPVAPWVVLGCASLNFAAGQTPAEIPLMFEPTTGGTAFIARGPKYALLVDHGRAAFRAGDSGLELRLVGANPNAEMIGVDPLETRVHYLIGPPDQWRTNVPTYARLECRDVYPGVDVVYYGDSSGRLEYDFRVRPGAEPAQIRVRFSGAESIQTDQNGDILLRGGGGEWRHSAPTVYQVRNGARRTLAGRFVLRGSDEIAIDVREYDRSSPLVIDPTLTFSTYLGGTGQNTPTSIAADAAGNLYLAGWTESADFPGAPNPTPGVRRGTEAYLAKLAASGKLLYVTYLGGSDDDRAYGVAVDRSGAPVLCGGSYSANFPLADAAQIRLVGGRDGFITKLNADGNAVVFSTYLGGAGADTANAVAIDAAGNVYVAGETASSDFPAVNGVQLRTGGRQDAFVAKLSAAGSLVYSSYLGGAGDDRATAIAVDAAGSAYITGSTYSTNFPLANAAQLKAGGGQDAFAAKLGPTGAVLLYSTYLGGSGGGVGAPESGNGIAVDAAGCAYITGSTSSSNFPVVNPFDFRLAGSVDAFVLKLNSPGNAIVYSTYLGGSSIDVATAIAVNSAGKAYVAGYTASTDFPMMNALQTSRAGDYDVFIATLSPGGSALEMATYFGGSGADSAAAIALDGRGGILVSGPTTSVDFPVAGSVQAYSPAMLCAAVFRIATSSVPASASFLKLDSTTQGAWKTSYGSDGYAIATDAAQYPAYAQVSIASQFLGAWTVSTPDPRGLQRASGSDRIASFWGAWYAFSADVNLIDGQPHQVAVYCLDWDSVTRAARIDVVDASTGALLDSRIVSGFNGGRYVVWTVTGHVTFRFTSTGGANVVLAGIFFGGGPQSVATFVKIDQTTRGGWKSIYGLDGVAIPGDSTRFPAYVQGAVASQFTGAWTTSTTDARALQKSSGTDRIAPFWGAWYTFNVTLNLIDAQPHQVSIYCLDWDSNARAMRIDVLDTSTGAVLDSRTVSSFNGGQYVVWNVAGNVTFRFTIVAGANTVISGLFFR